jgi:hypothetical protein
MAVVALVLPVSGPYTATWHQFALGTQNDDGFVLSATFQGQEVNLTDAYGMTLVEAIWRGLNWRLRFRGMEFNRPGILAALQAFGSTGAPSTTFTPTLANIGNRFSNFAQPLILTSTLAVQAQGAAFGSSANPAFIATLTALGAIVAPQSNVEYLFTSKVREAPFEMIFIPYEYTVGSLTPKLSFTTT